MLMVLVLYSMLKNGGSGMVCLLQELFSVVWHEKTVPRQYLIVEDPGKL